MDNDEMSGLAARSCGGNFDVLKDTAVWTAEPCQAPQFELVKSGATCGHGSSDAVAAQTSSSNGTDPYVTGVPNQSKLPTFLGYFNEQQGAFSQKDGLEMCADACETRNKVRYSPILCLLCPASRLRLSWSCRSPLRYALTVPYPALPIVCFTCWCPCS